MNMQQLLQELHCTMLLKLLLLEPELLQEIKRLHHLKSHFQFQRKEVCSHLDKMLLQQLVGHNLVKNQIILRLRAQMEAKDQKIFLSQYW